VLTDSGRMTVAAALVLIGAIIFTLFWTGAIGSGGDDDAVAGATTPTGTAPAVIVGTPGPTGTTTPTARPSSAPGTPITSPVDVPIMMYHIIGPPDRPGNEGLATSEADFAEQMDYLACAGYTTITVRQLFDAFEGTAALPEKPIVLTFDDGWAGQYTFGFPVLKSHGFVGSFAIVTGFVDQGGPYVTWAQIEEMSRAGMEMMSHTVTHLDLGANDDATDRDQLTTSKSDLESHTGKTVDYFVYPAGEPFRSGSSERQSQVVQLLRDAGYKGALLDGTGYGGQDPAHPYELNRVRVSAGEDIAKFAGSIYGPAPEDVRC
jgi:peptidoglycan/xylan/chitin deacetylase (PgdA/CDA1 family)